MFPATIVLPRVTLPLSHSRMAPASQVEELPEMVLWVTVTWLPQPAHITPHVSLLLLEKVLLLMVMMPSTVGRWRRLGPT